MPIPNEIDQIRETVAAWARNRELYPGWLIAPRETREVVWHYTSNWIRTVLDRLKEIEYEEQLEWCFELNWRLEVALVPLLPPLSDRIWELILAANPFADVASLPGGLAPEPRTEFKDLAKGRVRWVALAFAMLRFFREAGREDDFEVFGSRLEQLVRNVPDHVCRLAYERCLWALGRLDHVRAGALAKSTAVDDGDPFWLIRFAAVLSELDELEAAEKFADEGLCRIRSRIDLSGSDLAMPSREGWAMLLARGLKQSRLWGPFRSFDAVNAELRLFDGRWKQLDRLKCNPGPELEDLRLRLRHLPAPRPAESHSIGFDHAEMRRTTHFGDTILPERLLVALEANRLIEVAGYPPLCGSIQMSQDLLKTVVRHLGGQELSLVLPLILRAGDTSENDRFSRHEVAALDAEEARRLFALLYSAVANLFPIYERRDQRESIWSWKLHSFATAIDVLSRLTVRGSDDEIDQSLSLALRMLRLSVLRTDTNVSSHTGKLLARSVEAASPNLIAARAIDLMNLPLWPEANRPEVWFILSPGQLLEQRRVDLSRLVGNEQWHEAVEALLRAAERGRGIDRSDALLRLLVIYRNKGLTHDEANAFGQAFWRKDDSNGWQPPAYFEPNAMLVVPETEPGQGRLNFKRWCLEQPLPLFHASPPAIGTATPIVVNVDRDILLRTLLGVSREPDPAGNPIAVEWSGNEAEQLFDKFWSWWEAEGTETARLLEAGLVKDQVFARLYSGLKMIGYIVAPYAGHIYNFAPRVAGLIEKLDALKFPTVGPLPLLAGAIGLDGDQVEGRLRQALVSTDKRKVDAALDGVFEWAKWEKARKLGEIPVDFVSELANIIASRRRPGLRVALRVSRFIARRRPELIRGRIITLLHTGLDYLSTETQYERYPGDQMMRTIAYLEVPEFREEAAALAVALQYVTGFQNDPIITRWVDQARSDPLPELRRLTNEEEASA
jgi:hypothetical protein